MSNMITRRAPNLARHPAGTSPELVLTLLDQPGHPRSNKLTLGKLCSQLVLYTLPVSSWKIPRCSQDCWNDPLNKVTEDKGSLKPWPPIWVPPALLSPLPWQRLLHSWAGVLLTSPLNSASRVTHPFCFHSTSPVLAPRLLLIACYTVGSQNDSHCPQL
jgi:hypothetical protein